MVNFLRNHNILINDKNVTQQLPWIDIFCLVIVATALQWPTEGTSA